MVAHHNLEMPIAHPRHPANRVFVEDIYYMHLLFKELANRSLTLVHLSMSEYVVERSKHLVTADVYHKLKRPERFEFFQAQPGLLQSSDPTGAGMRCQPLRCRYQAVAAVSHCCASWTVCADAVVWPPSYVC